MFIQRPTNSLIARSRIRLPLSLFAHLTLYDHLLRITPRKLAPKTGAARVFFCCRLICRSVSRRSTKSSGLARRSLCLRQRSRLTLRGRRSRAGGTKGARAATGREIAVCEANRLAALDSERTWLSRLVLRTAQRKVFSCQRPSAVWLFADHAAKVGAKNGRCAPFFLQPAYLPARSGDFFVFSKLKRACAAARASRRADSRRTVSVWNTASMVSGEALK